MATRSLQASAQGIEKANLALGRYALNQNALAEDLGLSRQTVNNFFKGKPVDRENFALLCERLGLELENTIAPPSQLTSSAQSQNVDHFSEPRMNNLVEGLPKQEWGEAPDVSHFSGRTNELKTLKQWINEENCRIVTLLGFGGVGKTDLATKLVQEIQDKFDFIFWQSLRESPPLHTVLSDLVRFLSRQKEFIFPREVDESISSVIKYFKVAKCLLILDNVESILEVNVMSGKYREGFKEYGKLFQRIAQTASPSCLILTTREKPYEITRFEGGNSRSRVRVLPLVGSEDAARYILKDKNIIGTDEEISSLINIYEWNPLIIEIIAGGIQESCNGKIVEYFHQKNPLFESVTDELEKQFNRLSSSEKMIMYWLSINRESMSALEICESDIDATISEQESTNCIASLTRRSFIKQVSNKYTLQNVVMEYVTEKILNIIRSEISTGRLDLFTKIPLVKATSKDYIRETQERLIIQKIKDKLIASEGGKPVLESRLKSILKKLKEIPNPRYAAGNLINLFRSLDTNLSGFNFSHLPIRQAFMSGLILNNVDFSHSEFSEVSFSETFGSILSAAFNSDGSTLVTGDSNGEIRLWQTKNWIQTSTSGEDDNRIWSVSFRPDGEVFASGSADGTVRLWGVKDGHSHILKRMREHKGRVWSLAFSPDGKILATGSDDKTIKLWNGISGEYLNDLGSHNTLVRSISFSPDGTIIASGGDDQKIKFWNINTGKCITIIEAGTAWLWSIAFIDDNTIACGGEGNTLKFWNIQTNECLKTLEGHKGGVWSVISSPSKKILASVSEDGNIRLWSANVEPSTNDSLQVLTGHTNRIWSIAFSPDSKILTSVSDDQTIRVWDVHTGKCIKILQGYTNRIWSIAFSPDGKTLASGNDSRRVSLWDLDSTKHPTIQEWPLEGHESQVWSVAFSPDGRTVVSASDDKTIKVWDFSTRKYFKTLKGHTNRIWSIAFHPKTEAQIIATGSGDGTIKLWNTDTDTDTYFKSIQSHMGYQVRSVAFSPDGEILASASDDHTVKLWDTKSWQCLKTLKGHTDWVHSISFSPNGYVLASGGCDNLIRLWDLRSGSYLQTLEENDRVRSLAFSPDGKILASACDDHTVKLWDTKSGQRLKILEGHKRWVRAVAFAPGGEVLATCSEDETIRIWNARTGECRTPLWCTKPYEGMNINEARGLLEAQKHMLIALGAVETEF